MKKRISRLISLLLAAALLLTGCSQKEDPRPQNEITYENAQILLSEGKYDQAAAEFEKLNGYEDSMLLTVYCRSRDKLEKGEYALAVAGFASISSFRDSALAAKYAAALFESEGSDQAKLKAATQLDEIPLYLDSQTRAEGLRSDMYKKAEKQFEEKEYANAYSTFMLLGEYKDSRQMSEYVIASEYESAGTQDVYTYLLAVDVYESLNGFKDSQKRADDIIESVYTAAEKALSEGDNKIAYNLYSMLAKPYASGWTKKERAAYKDSENMIVYTNAAHMQSQSVISAKTNAAASFESLGEFRDSQTRALEIRESIYNHAVLSMESGDYQTADLYFSVQDYKDSKEMRKYSAALALEKAGESDDSALVQAAFAFENMGDFKDSIDRAQTIRESIYQKGVTAMENGDYFLANKAFAIQDYKDGEEMRSYVYALYSEKAAEANDAALLNAAVLYEQMNGFKDSKERAESIREGVYQKGVTAIESGDYALANACFSMQNYKDSRKMAIYAEARSAEASSITNSLKIEAALKYEDMPGFLDADERAQALRRDVYQKAQECLSAEDFEQAKTLFSLQTQYMDSEALFHYTSARALEKQAETDIAFFLQAADIYQTIASFSDASARAESCLQNAYNGAWRAFENSDYAKAAEVFAALNDYEDSANAAIYAKAVNDVENGKNNHDAYIEAKAAFATLSGYKDSDARAEKIDRQLFVRFVDQIGTFSEEGLASFEKNGKWGYLNTDGEIVINAKYDMAYEFSEGLAAVKLADKWGFINPEGKVVIDLQYINADSFSCGYAAVFDGSINAWKYIDKNNAALNIEYKSIMTAFPFINGFACIENSSLYSTYTRIINTKGDTVSHSSTLEFHEGIAVVKNNYSEYGYMREDGSMLSDSIWYEAKPFQNGIGIVCSKDKKYGAIDTGGNIVLSPEWDSISSPSCGLMLVSKDGFKGYSDTKGNIVSEPQWNYAYSFTDSLGLVWKDGFYGFIDTNGNTVIDFVYDDALPFENGSAAVKQYGKWMLIDTSGNLLLGFDSSITEIKGSFSDTLICLKNASGNYGYVDHEGNTVIPFKFYEAYAFSDGLACVRLYRHNSFYSSVDETGKETGSLSISNFRYENGVAVVNTYSGYNLIDKNGNELISGSVGDLNPFSEGIARIRMGGYRYIDTSGRLINQESYNYAYDFSGGIAYVYNKYSFYNSNAYDIDFFPIDTKGRRLLLNGTCPCGIYAMKLNDAWYLTDVDGNIVL